MQFHSILAMFNMLEKIASNYEMGGSKRTPQVMADPALFGTLFIFTHVPGTDSTGQSYSFFVF